MQVRIGGARPNFLFNDPVFVTRNRTAHFWRFINETFFESIDVANLTARELQLKRIGQRLVVKRTNRKQQIAYEYFPNQRLVEPPQRELNDYRIFVTSDTPSVIEDAMHVFGDETVVGTSDTSIQLDKHSFLGDSECRALTSVFVDFYLLSRCDMGVISHSGFGMYGLLNKKSVSNYQAFYVYTHPGVIGNHFWRREEFDLDFFKFEPSIIYVR